MATEVIKYYGTAGTGKTTMLISTLEKMLETYSWNEICYITFSRSAKNDVVSRILKKFPNIEKRNLIYVSTQHSICYRLLGLTPQRVVTWSLKQKVCDLFSIKYNPSKQSSIEDLADLFETDNTEGAKIFGVFDKIRLTGHKVTLQTVSTFGGELHTPAMTVMDMWHTYEKLKEAEDKLDYTDMLEQVYINKLCPPVKILFADEFQDFGRLQYNVYKLWEGAVEKSFIAGDDDQCITAYVGASPKYMLEHPGKEIVLPVNYRNCSNIFDYATKIIKRNTYRKQKHLTCAHDGGVVENVQPEFISTARFVGHVMASPHRKRFFLVRTNYYAMQLAEKLIALGVPFHQIRGVTSWSDDFVKINNFICRLRAKQPIPYSEARAVFLNLPSATLLRRGVKKELKEHPFKNESKTFDGWCADFLKINVKLDYMKLLEHIDLSGTQRDILKANSNNGFTIVEGINSYIGTMHSSKGLECDEVYLFDSIPARVQKSLIEHDNVESERRLYFVAITRGREQVKIVNNYFPGGIGFLEYY